MPKKSVSLENNTMAQDLTSHFLDVHQAYRVWYLGCSAEPAISDLRESHYREILKKHGITAGENDICHCGYDEGFSRS